MLVVSHYITSFVRVESKEMRASSIHESIGKSIAFLLKSETGISNQRVILENVVEHVKMEVGYIDVLQKVMGGSRFISVY